MNSKQQAYNLYTALIVGSILLTTVGSLIGGGMHIVTQHPIAFLVGTIALFVGTLLAKGPLKIILFGTFSFFEGVAIAPIISYYLNINPAVIVSTLVVTTLITGIFLFLGYRAKNLAPMGKYLFAALMGLIILSLIGIFARMAFTWVSYLAVFIFSGYISFDINRFKRELENRGQMSLERVVQHAVDMYLNIINLFLRLLEIIGDLKD